MEAYTISGNVVDKQVMDELILLDLKTGDYHALNETASFIWKQLRLEASENDIAIRLNRKFDIEIQDALEDVRNVFQQLKGLGFIE